MAEPTPSDRARLHSVAPVPFVEPDRRVARPPAPFTSFVGREREVAALVGVLRRPDARLVTLTGPGGVGKTRLAPAVAAGLGDDFPGGVAWVDLAPLADPDLVAATVAQALGVREAGDRPAERLAEALRGREPLLVLDNVEQVVEGAAFVVALLAACTSVKALATSREPLRLSPERVVAVPPLAVTDSDRAADEPAAPDAVRLFVDRAQAVRADFALTAADAAAVAAICVRLDGLPLAIELAAARSNVLAPRALLARLDRRLPVLTGGPRDGPPRQRTMRAAIAWGYDLLAPDEQALLRCLSVFAGGFAPEAAAWVMGEREGSTGTAPSTGEQPTPSPPRVLDCIDSLVAKSLVRREAGEDPRFSLLETVREYACERLLEADERDAVADAHADWCLDLAEGSGQATFLPDGERQLRRLEVEHANLRGALDWLHQRGDGDRLLRLAAALGAFWYALSRYWEGRAWLERALAGARGAPSRARGHALVELGHLRYWQGETAGAEELFGEGITILREHGDVVATSGVLIWQGAIACHLGDHDRAERLLEEALGLAATIPDPSIAASVTGRAHANLGVVAHGRGNLEGARARHEQALRIAQAHGYGLGVIRSLCDLGDVARDRGAHAASVGFYRESLALVGGRGDLRVVADALAGIAVAAAAWRQPERAARLLGAGEALRERFGGVVAATDRPAHGRAVTVVRAALGEQGLRAAWSAGRGLPLATAVAEAHAVEPAPATAERPVTDAGNVLSQRERDVLLLLAAGHTNREIAAALSISVRTVESHVRHLLAKLGVPTRTAAARAAVAAGLVPPDALARPASPP